MSEDYDLPQRIRQLEGEVESLKAQCGIAMIDGYRKGRRAGLEEAALLVELEYAADKKQSDRLKQIARHIRNFSEDIRALT